jgi:HD-GYP domain-containing protein (c-di-GMP phosphodiesterase class II)
MTPPEEVITPDRLRVGLYVRLDGWISHPFLFNAFKIRDEKQIEVLRSLGLKEIHYVPARSDCGPLDAEARSPEPVAPRAPSVDPAIQEMWREKKARREKIALRRALINQCERHFQQGVTTFKSLLGNFFSRPREVVECARGMVGEMVDSLLQEKDALIHLVNVKEGDESAHYHALNVTVLSLLLAREAKLSEQAMRELGLGTLLHDIGKAEIPSRILLKRTVWTTAELSLYEQHVAYGLKMAEKLPDLPAGTLAVIGMHHEMLDGSGFPNGLSGDAIPIPARIAAIANTYDNLCNHVVTEDSLTPAEALSHMFKRMRGQLDPELLQLFIRCMGVYPPGSIVQLNNDTIGIVTGSSGGNLLQPTILIYDPVVPKDEAVFFNLDDEPDLKVVRTLRPGILPREIFEYLNPRTRVVYEVGEGGRSDG